jgi:hypothetical protein
MHRIILPVTLALIGLLGFGSISPALPSAHAQTATPALTVAPSPAQVGSTATVTGSGFSPNNWAYVTFQRPDGTVNAIFVPTSSSGTLSFTLGFSVSHGTGSESLKAYDYGSARWSALTTIMVTSSSPIPVRTLTTSTPTAAAGTTVTVSGAGFTPNNWVYVYFQRPDGTAGAFWTVIAGAGTFASLLGFNAAHGCGTETIWAYDYGTRAWSAPASLSVTGCSGLAAPSDLRLVSSNVGTASDKPATVTLQWRDNSGAETGFRIRTTLTRLYGGTDTQTQVVGPNTTAAEVSFVAGGINPVKTACFTVTAFNATAESAPSNQACVQLIP